MEFFEPTVGFNFLMWISLLGTGFYFATTIHQMKYRRQVVTFLFLILSFTVITWMTIVIPVSKAKQGTPIRVRYTSSKEFSEKLFHPHEFLRFDQKLVLYDQDGKFYDLSEISLAPGLSPGNLTTEKGALYRIQYKGKNLYLVKL